MCIYTSWGFTCCARGLVLYESLAEDELLRGFAFGRVVGSVFPAVFPRRRKDTNL